MTSTAQPYDNNGQYSNKSILRYEKIFGPGYISTGGHETTEYLCEKLGDALGTPGRKVLDVGGGIGGAAFHLAKAYGAKVTCLDLSPEMTNIGLARAAEAQVGDQVQFLLGDVLVEPLDGPYDVLWSRDALMHIPDKPRLFKRMFDLTAPGGSLVITDYARGAGDVSQPFLDYIKATGYSVTDPASYGKLLEGAGYTDVVVEDATGRFLDILRAEATRLVEHRADFLQAFSEQDLDYLVDRWNMKVGFCEAGDMKWGIYRASKPA